MATKARKDSRGYALKKGESQRKDGRYVFRYTTIRGEQKAVYAKELSELRKKEVKIRRAIEDGLDPDRAERITLNELFDEYISQKYDPAGKAGRAGRGTGDHPGLSAGAGRALPAAGL